jgi:hypothetical protein
MPSCPYCDRQWPVGVPHWCPQMQAADNEATADKKPEGGQPAAHPPGRVRASRGFWVCIVVGLFCIVGGIAELGSSPGSPPNSASASVAFALAIAFILGGIYLRYRRTKPKRPAPSDHRQPLPADHRQPLPADHWQPFPADSSVRAQLLPPPGHFVGYIGVGSWFSRKYWTCPHDHQSADEALVCARNQLNSGRWDGRVTHGG